MDGTQAHIRKCLGCRAYELELILYTGLLRFIIGCVARSLCGRIGRLSSRDEVACCRVFGGLSRLLYL
jgi:hypothetical protein